MTMNFAENGCAKFILLYLKSIMVEAYSLVEMFRHESKANKNRQ